MVRTLFAVALAALFSGCTTHVDNAPKFSETQQAHPATWVNDHWASFIQSPDQCRTCHGSDLNGGISNVTCFQCHHPNGPSHLTGWANHLQHGRNGAQLAATDTSGFAYCSKCHGSNYNNPAAAIPSCVSCHSKAPHPDKPWTGPTADTSNHTFTDISNAPECFKCHANGANSDLKPTNPAPAGTAPGCFNNTLCHGTSI